MNKDIKYLGVPNVCFSLTVEGDDREEEFLKQREERGFDDSETWCLCSTIAKFIIPRLERYNEIANEALVREPTEKEEIESLLEAFKLLDRDDGIWIFSDEERAKVDEGLSYFADVFQGLWW